MRKYIYTLLTISVSFFLQAQTFVPGSFSGSLDVTPLGGASYTVPIDLPPGIGNIQPQIGLVYNSHGGDGILGKGFSLSGISSITRRSKTLFHEGYIEPVTFSASDSYSFDGSVLKPTGVTNEFRTEVNNSSRIKIFAPNTNSAYFTVESKDGLIYEYGNTTDSRLYAQGTNSGQITIWMLKKVRDRVGRYYTYTYEKNEANGELRIKQIDYTGSSLAAPFYSIKFNYTSRTYDVNLNYVSGSQYKESKLLSTIQICYGATVLRNYALQYEYFDYNYLLNKISVTAKNNEALKPIEFTWYKNSDFKQTQIVYDKTSNLNKAVITLGDFNGDGRTDFVATPMQDAGWTGWRLYLANADGNGFTYTSSGSIVEGLIRIIPGDFNGDGITDFIAHRNLNGSPNVERTNSISFSYTDRFNIQEGYRWDITEAGRKVQDGSVISFMTENDSLLFKKELAEKNLDLLLGDTVDHVLSRGTSYDNYFVYYGTGTGFTYTSPAIITVTRKHNVKTGDFNGDGAVDFFVYYTDKNSSVPDYDIRVSNYSGGVLTAFKSSYSGRLLSTDKWDRVEVWDFNGDGRAEVMNLHEDGYNYYKNIGGNISKERDSFFPKKKHKINFGDFNGDGKTDMLLTGYDGIEWSNWQIHLSTGIGFKDFSFPKKFNAYSKEIYVCDLNGDGKDDFFAVDKKASGMTPLMYYIGYDNGRNFRAQTGTNVYDLETWSFYPIDSRGDGRYGFITTSFTGSWSGYQLYLPPSNFTDLVNTIKDSYGNQSILTYKRMTDPTVYTKTNLQSGSASTNKYDCLSFSAPFKFLAGVRTNDGVGGYRDMTYKYEDAKLFKRGRGILGFTKIIKTDVSNSLQTTITQEFSDTYFQPATKQIEERKTTTNRILSITDYVNKLNVTSGIFSFNPSSVTNKTYEPNSNYVVKSVTTSYTYDTYNNVLTEITSSGNGDKSETTNSYDYNTALWFIGQLKQKKVNTVINGRSQINTVDYKYYTNGSLEKEIIEPLNSKLQIETSYTYDSYGNVLTKSSKADGQTRTESYTYTSGRYPATFKDVQGNIVEYKYYPETGLMDSESSCGIKKTYTYDGFGRIKTEITNNGESVSTNLYWSNGSPANSVVRKEEVFSNGQVLKTWFDAYGREIQVEEKNFEGKAVTIKKTYNALGHLISVSEPYFNSPQLYTTYTYDAYGRISTEATLLGTISYSYSGTSAGARTIITDKTKGTSFTSTRTYDLAGKEKTIADSGGETITYTYGSSGKPSKIQCGTAIYEMEYDLLGRQTSLKDPNAGKISYNYTAWGELKTKTDARNQVESYSYHPDGRISSYKRGNETFTYTYKTGTDIPKDQIARIANTTGLKTEYEYDSYGRNTRITETVEPGKSFVFDYKYNAKNQLEQVVYPGNKSIKYEYAYGDLRKIIWVPTATVIWEKLSDNARGQLGSTKLGNGIQTNYQYTAVGIPTSIKALNGSTAILNMSYPSGMIDSRGNITQRSDINRNLSESFSYDNLNRLSSSSGSVTYLPNGNITTKQGVGTYSYNSTRPHAVSGLTNVQSENIQAGLSITYNSLNLPEELSLSSTHKYTLTYGIKNQRVKSVYQQPGVATRTKYYVGPYEEIVRGSSVQKNYYIYAAGELVSVYTEGHPELSTGLYYFHNDHLGSPWVITNSSKAEIQRLSYDAWGRRRDPNNWNNYLNLPSMKFDRGYTGHEHLDMFGLINMNARLYDPVLGRFLSADPYVQAPDFSQAYNRYTYAMNNPMMYVDPDGEAVWFIGIVALAGGIVNVAANWDNIDGFWQGVATFGVGAGAALAVTLAAVSGGSTLAVVGVAAGGNAVTLGTNSIVAQTGTNFSGFNKIDWKRVGKSFAIGVVSGSAAGVVGFWAMNTAVLVNGVSHPLVKSAIVSPIASATGHVVGGTTAGLLEGESFGTAFGNSFDGIGQSMAMGTAMGVGTTMGAMYASGLNPFSNRALAARGNSKIAVQFGKTENQIHHAFRHTDALGLDRSLVQSTIQNHFKTVSSQVLAGKPFNQIIEIGGQRIQYTAFKLSDGTFNIGRIHGIK